MKKYILDLTVTENARLHAGYALLKMTSGTALPPMVPGQFAEIRIDGSPATFLRRPISIHHVDRERNEVWFLVRPAGDGTRRLTEVSQGETVNAVLPLGRGFTLPSPDAPQECLLIGGGVGVAPLYYLGAELASRGSRPTFLLGARSEQDLLQLDAFRRTGPVLTTTEDGSHGEKGFVTQHPILSRQRFDRLYVCGPKPMMMAVARMAKAGDMECEVSLENRMACGVGACLCCVENTVEGHVCVCKEGPVFNIKQLLWQI